MFSSVLGGGVEVLCSCPIARYTVRKNLFPDPMNGETLEQSFPISDPDALIARECVNLWSLPFLLSQDGERLHTLLALGVSWSTAVVWFALFQLHGVTNPILYWLPLGPVVWVHVAIDLKRSAARLDAELEQLNAARYKYKDL